VQSNSIEAASRNAALEPVRVFVYGTLKRGLRNYPAMQGAGVSEVQTAYLRGVALYHVPSDPARRCVLGSRHFERPYPYPCLISGRGMVLGELHTLGASELEPQDALMVLDHLELEGLEYRRVKTWAHCRGQRIRAWVYVYHSKRLVHRVRAKQLQKLTWSD
jgi:gamma-glutamylcyclotransferase (GGCT)/AIG2-like uncharacterized protein YtfP